MKKAVLVLGLFISSISLLSQVNSNEQEIFQRAEKKIDSLFASYTTVTPGAAVAIVKDGKVIFKKGYGMADLNHDVPITPQTVFNIASVSKQFTAFAIYLLESEGMVSFEDDIRKYIPEIPDFGVIIRIKHLLGHTGGLRDQAALTALAGGRAGDIQTTQQIIRLLVKQKSLNYPPGTQFNYSNTGYTLLAEIIQRITGKTFATYAEEKIFKPLGMTSTQVYDNHEKIVKNKAESYEKRDGIYYHKPLNTSNAGPSNVLTTVEDLSKWVINLENPQVGNKRMINAFNESSYLDNGQKTVLRIIDGDTIFHAKGQNLSDYKGIRMFSHGGHTAAFRTFQGRFPDQHFAIIVLSNDEHNEQLGARWQIADFYLKDQLMEEKIMPMKRQNDRPVPTPTYSTSIREFEGEYHSDELSTSYTFEVLGEKVIMKHARLDDLEMKQIGENKFSGSGPETFSFEMEFLRNKKSEVTGFSVSNFGAKNVHFIKVK